MARGRDATDVAISTSFGPNTLASFKVVTDEVSDAEAARIEATLRERPRRAERV
jgi:hypothetical protein